MARSPRKLKKTTEFSVFDRSDRLAIRLDDEGVHILVGHFGVFLIKGSNRFTLPI